MNLQKSLARISVLCAVWPLVSACGSSQPEPQTQQQAMYGQQPGYGPQGQSPQQPGYGPQQPATPYPQQPMPAATTPPPAATPAPTAAPAPAATSNPVLDQATAQAVKMAVGPR